jgi:hypothetical protein
VVPLPAVLMTVGSPFASNSKGKAPLSHQSWVIYVVQVSGAGVALAGVLYATQRNLTHSLRKERFDAYSRFTATANRGFRLIGQFQLKGGAQEGLQEGFRDYSDRMSDALAALNLAAPKYVREKGLILLEVISSVTRDGSETFSKRQAAETIKKPINVDHFSDAFNAFLDVSRFDLRHQWLSSVKSLFYWLRYIHVSQIKPPVV